MATLTLTLKDLSTIEFKVTDYDSQYADHASVCLYEGDSTELIDVRVIQNLSTTTEFSGSFTALKSYTVYRVWSEIRDSNNNVTSSLQTYLETTFLKVSGYHSIFLYPELGGMSGGEINTYNTWGLIPVERPIISAPQVKVQYVELPGSNESIDYTNLLTGTIPKGQRTGSWTFYWDSDWPGSEEIKLRKRKVERSLWLYIYDDILNRLHGRDLRLMLEDQPSIIYHGRIVVSKWDTSNIFSKITFNYNLDPEYKQVDPSTPTSDTNVHFDG